MPSLSLRQKLLAPLAFCLLALLTLTLFNAYQARDKAYEARQQALRDFVDSADSMIAGIAAEAKAGKLSEEDAKATAIVRVGQLRYAGGSGYITNITTGSVVLNNPSTPKFNGKFMGDFQDAKGGYLYRTIAAVGASAQGNGIISYWWPRPGAKEPSEKIAYVKRSTSWNWDLVAGDYVDDIQQAFVASLIKSLVVLAVLAALLAVIAWLTMRSVLNAIGGEPAFAAEIANRIAGGDLSQSGLEAASRAPEGSVIAAVERMSAQLRQLVTRIHETAGVIHHSAGEIATGGLDLSQRTEQQASSLEETAASMEELTATVQQNAENAQRASQIATGACTVAERGGAGRRWVPGMRPISRRGPLAGTSRRWSLTCAPAMRNWARRGRPPPVARCWKPSTRVLRGWHRRMCVRWPSTWAAWRRVNVIRRCAWWRRLRPAISARWPARSAWANSCTGTTAHHATRSTALARAACRHWPATRCCASRTPIISRWRCWKACGRNTARTCRALRPSWMTGRLPPSPVTSRRRSARARRLSMRAAWASCARVARRHRYCGWRGAGWRRACWQYSRWHGAAAVKRLLNPPILAAAETRRRENR